jgi:hypothetical protein
MIADVHVLPSNVKGITHTSLIINMFEGVRVPMLLSGVRVCTVVEISIR